MTHLAADVAALLRSAGWPTGPAGRPRVWLLGPHSDTWRAMLAAHALEPVEPWAAGRADPRAGAGSPGGPLADVAVASDPGWLPASGFQRRRLLRGLRHGLCPGGLLVLATDGPGRADLAAAVTAAAYRLVPTSLPYVVARAEPVAGPDLAGAAYAQPPDDLLDLRWSPDEIDWLVPDPRRVWADVLAAGPVAVADRARAYQLADPYGGSRLATVLAEQFGVPLPAERLTLGAGVASLLRDLIDLADGGPVLAGAHCFADVPGWARRLGSAVHTIDDSAPPATWLTTLHRVRPALLLIDRPTLFGAMHPVTALEPVIQAAARSGTIVLIDESYANYLGARASAAPLTDRADNLVVLRGLSKGYCLGGLRIGLAISCAGLAPAVRELVPALQAAELSAIVALRLLALGDVFGRLRERIGHHRPLVERGLRTLGLRPAGGHPALPWFAVSDPDAGGRLLDRGIRPKLLPGRDPVVKVAVPLSDARLRAFLDATR